MRVAVTGGTGFVGRFFVLDALSRGEDVRILSRTPPGPADFPARVEFSPYLLGEAPDLRGVDLVIHAAFHHIPGRYRGGEGDDPDGFRRANIDGTLRLFRAAADVAPVIFLSSRAVYGDYPPGTLLTEDLPPRPDTLYGRVKLAGEQALMRGVSLRVTGVFGEPAPGRPHKWASLFKAMAAGEPVPPRAGTEVWGADVASAARLALAAGERLVNVSDLIVDTRDLAELAATVLARPVPLPERTDPAQVSAMSTARLDRLGWRPGGRAALARAVAALLA